MKKRNLLVLFMGLILCGCQMKEVKNEYNVVPLPVSMTEQPGRFELDGNVQLVANASPEVNNLANELAATLKKTSGITLKSVETLQEGAPSIVFEPVEGLADEAYRLSVTPQRITLSASNPHGFFYAMQSLYQLMPAAIYGQQTDKQAEWSVPCVEIADKPAFKYRGAMLDVSRHFASVDYVKRFIDVLAAHKMNIFHWHLTDDQGWRIEIKKYPKLTEIGSQRSETMVDFFYTHYPFKFDGKPHGGYYTQEQIKDVVAYAQSKHITVIPEIELPGHALAAIASYPELSCTPNVQYEVCKLWGVFDQVYCPTEKFFQFMEGVMDEVIELFPSSYIHIGGDECPKTAWEQCAHCQQLIRQLGLKNDVKPNPIDGHKHTKEEKLQSYIVGRVEKYLNSKGRNIIGWDEILEGGLAPNATVMSWRGVEGGLNAAKAGHDAIMTPNPYAYLDHYQEEPEIAPVTIGGYNTLKKTYSYNPVPADADSLVKQHIIGVQANCWAEYMPTEARRDYQIFPRLIAIAETGWTPMTEKNFQNFCSRMVTDFQRLEALGMKPCLNFFDVNINTRSTADRVLNVELETFYPKAEIRYTTDGSEPTATSTLYTQPFALDGTYDLQAAAFVNGQRIGKVTHKPLYKNLITGKAYELTPAPRGMKGDIFGENDILGTDTVTLGLTNGKRGNNASSTPWVGVRPEEKTGLVTFTVDFAPTQVSKVRFGTLYNAANGILPTSHVAVYVADAKGQWKQVAEKAMTYPKETSFKGFDWEIEFPAQETNRIKIEFKSGGKFRNGVDCYSPHDNSEQPSTLALDEIEIY